MSHRSAAALWDLRPAAESRIDVTAPRGSRARRAGIAIHRPRQLHRDDRAIRSGIPVTAVSRTLLDIAEVVRGRQLERAIDQAERLQLFDLNAIEDLRARSRGRQGLAALDAVLAEYRGPAPTHSELERLFLNLCRQANRTVPATNAFVAGLEVDAVWHNERLVVELDGYEYHRTRQAFEQDRVRDGILQRAGYRVWRLTYRRVERDAAEVVDELRAMLGA